MYMEKIGILDLRKEISRLLKQVAKGRQFTITRRNIPVAIISPVGVFTKNQTRLGSGRGSVQIKADLTEPFLEHSEWDMHK